MPNSLEANEDKGHIRQMAGFENARLLGALTLALCTLVACGERAQVPSAPAPSGGSAGTPGSGGDGGGVSGGTGGTMGSAGAVISLGGMTQCVPKTCAELGWACGSTLDGCGNIVDCANEGLGCNPLEACIGGVDSPTECVTSAGPCEVCSGIADCSAQPQPTRLTGRVVSPGRQDADAPNQVGVPNALVYILRNKDLSDLPAMPAGLPEGGDSCDRCEDQDLGEVLVGAVTDSTGHFVLEENVPIGVEFVLVVKAGKFRRAVMHTVPETGSCQTTTLPAALPENPTRLPRNMTDGLAVNIPRVAVSTGAIDAMECVLEKMGLSHSEFTRPSGDGRIHLYRSNGAWPDAASSQCNACGTTEDPADVDCRTANCGAPEAAARTEFLAALSETQLVQDAGRISEYDIAIFDCEQSNWDSNFMRRNASGHNIRDYVNRGGRMFASHLRFSWLHQNGTDVYDAANPWAAGLGPAATWTTGAVTNVNTGTGIISLGRPNASPRIESFAEWMANESVTTAPEHTFNIVEPRSQVLTLGDAAEEFVHCEDADGAQRCTGMAARTQQFSFNTPYAAPAEASCGRVAYSGFHVSIGMTGNQIFPSHCTGDLTDQEKVLLYMLFDLGACVGDDPPPPDCQPVTCESVNAQCGFIGDGCGKVLDCDVCPPPR